jgi:hypothetical protein
MRWVIRIKFRGDAVTYVVIAFPGFRRPPPEAIRIYVPGNDLVGGLAHPLLPDLDPAHI